ncbi:peptidylprolyl isomerase [Undibacterium terreum]|uniref:peptidylprolyl isomerase n=1 Tax=Undibacterium terreum TaxID=1224302 RepID=A0A916UZT1_9BURK|nr:peptidylprolyl isomerase [Undibacterium terreum]GGC96232.1 peptidylprolyl isomerase [Undibacterium terreum]
MLIKSRVAIAVSAAVALLALSACTPKEGDKAAASTTATADKGAIAATVNGTPITQKRLDQIMQQQALQQGMPDNAETRKLVIDNLAMQLLVAQEATTKGLDKSPEVAEQIEMTKQSILAQAFVQDYIKNSKPTDEAIKAEYDKVAAQSGKQYEARHILVKTEEEAKDIIAKLKKDPKQFEALAKAKSMDPGSKDKGGDLGWFDPRGMVPEFGAAVAKLEKGKFTEEPVKSQFGYHVIMLEDSRPEPVPSLEEVKPKIAQQLQQQNLKKLLDDMKAKAKIEITGAPAAAAGAASAAASAPAATGDAAKK